MRKERPDGMFLLRGRTYYVMVATLSVMAVFVGVNVGNMMALGLACGVARAESPPATASESSVALRQSAAGPGVWRSPTGVEIELLLTAANLNGAEVEIGEITFPPGYASGAHVHGATEIFYVLEGELEHVVDGVSEVLGPGDVGFVRPPSEVDHVTAEGGGPVRALVIWAPGGEGSRIVSEWERR